VKRLLAIALFAFQFQVKAVTYYFEGSLSGALGDYSVGTTFSGSFSYEYPQASNLIPSSYSLPSVQATYIPTNISLTIGSETIMFDNPTNLRSIEMYNQTAAQLVGVRYQGGWPTDTFQIQTSGNGSLGGKEVRAFQLTLTDETGAAFSDLNLVGDTMRGTDFTGGYFKIQYVNYVLSGFSYVPQNMELSSPVSSLVPEPSSLSLLALGGLVVAVSRRKK
jgi:hypothetical protein